MIKTVLEELDCTLTCWLINFTNLFGWSRTANKALRPAVLRFFGYSFGKDCCLFPNMRIFARRDKLKVGDNCFINQHCFFDAAESITIGDYCQIGFYTSLVTSSHEIQVTPGELRAPKAAPIIIEDYVWIGSNVTILLGVTIGRGSIVAAGSVVTKDIPENSIAMGVPARVVKEVESSVEAGELRVV